MLLRQWFQPPRHLLALFVAVIVIPAIALAWLGWRFLEQDRALEGQRMQERLEHAADLIGAALERRLAEIADQLPSLAASTPAEFSEDALLVTLGPHSVEAYPSARLLFRPFLPPAPDPPANVFEAGEAREFQQQDYTKAAAAFRELARSKDSVIRAGALLRLGRNLRKSRQFQEALAAYGELARLGAVPVGDLPAELLARQARCALLAEMKRPELGQEAAALYADLQHGRWPLDRDSYQFHTLEALRWLPGSSLAQADHQDALALSAAVEWLAEHGPELRRGEGSGRGRRSLGTEGRSLLLVWNSSPQKLFALVAGPRYLESQWRSVWKSQGMELALTDSEGHRVLGSPISPGQPHAVRAAADTGLPWTLRVASGNRSADLASLAGRRRMVLAGLALVGFLVLFGSYFIARAMTRELAVARLQSDFVSAVSHEFRTPLTSMSHLTEMLLEGSVSSEERRRQYYSVLARETDRLHRVVESLLDFGRMEAGALEYRLQPLDPAVLVEDVVAEFQAQIAPDGHRVELNAERSAARVRADPEALGCALWNLLDNAVKYSPDCPTIWVELAASADRVAIRVRDQGVGIPAPEQQEIFHKFVRGAASKASGVKGTGIGLAMVERIVEAHGGEVRVESQPGRGSTFTILLPAGDSKI